MKPILLVGESWGQDEQRIGMPFVGASGVELLRMLVDAEIITFTSYDRERIKRYWATRDPKHTNEIWLQHTDEIRRTNVFNIHPPGNELEFFCGPADQRVLADPAYPALVKSKFVRREFEPELDRLAAEIIELDPDLIIVLGNTPLWALLGRTGIKAVRGTTFLSTHTVVDFKCLATYHPAFVLRQYELRPTVVADLRKARNEAKSPSLNRPTREIWIEPSLDDVGTFIKDHIQNCPLLSVDIETSGSRITCLGMAPSPRIAIVIPFDDERSADGNYWPTREAERQCWDLIAGVLSDPSIPKLFQNGLYDITFLWRSMRVKVLGATHDTMLLQHSLQPEMLKALDYLGSLYSDEGAWKAEARAGRKKSKTIKRDS